MDLVERYRFLYKLRNYEYDAETFNQRMIEEFTRKLGVVVSFFKDSYKFWTKDDKKIVDFAYVEVEQALIKGLLQSWLKNLREMLYMKNEIVHSNRYYLAQFRQLMYKRVFDKKANVFIAKDVMMFALRPFLWTTDMRDLFRDMLNKVPRSRATEIVAEIVYDQTGALGRTYKQLERNISYEYNRLFGEIPYMENDTVLPEPEEKEFEFDKWMKDAKLNRLPLSKLEYSRFQAEKEIIRKLDTDMNDFVDSVVQQFPFLSKRIQNVKDSVADYVKSQQFVDETLVRFYQGQDEDNLIGRPITTDEYKKILDRVEYAFSIGELTHFQWRRMEKHMKMMMDSDKFIPFVRKDDAAFFQSIVPDIYDKKEVLTIVGRLVQDKLSDMFALDAPTVTEYELYEWDAKAYKIVKLAEFLSKIQRKAFKDDVESLLSAENRTSLLRRYYNIDKPYVKKLSDIRREERLQRVVDVNKNIQALLDDPLLLNEWAKDVFFFDNVEWMYDSVQWIDFMAMASQIPGYISSFRQIFRNVADRLPYIPNYVEQFLQQ